MVKIGMFALGAFIGSAIWFALISINDWSDPVTIISGLIGIAIAGSIVAFLKLFHLDKAEMSFYPVGLGYGALCGNLGWLKTGDLTSVKMLHIGGVALVTIALFIYGIRLMSSE